MVDILRDPAWQFVGAVFALLAVIATVWIFLAQRPRKRLQVETVARVPLVAVGSNGIPGLQITFNGSTVENASIFVLRIENIGNVPILAADVDQPLALEFDEGSRVLNAWGKPLKPRRLPIDVTFGDRSVIIGPNLLNAGDTFLCRVLVQDAKLYTATARIAGISEIDTQRTASWRQPIAMIVGWVALAIAFAFTPKPMSMGLWETRAEEIPYMLLAALGIGVLFTTNILEIRKTLTRVRKIRESKGPGSIFP